MAELVLMPRQGNTVESCIILEWKVTEGEHIEKGSVLCTVETDKATIDVESDYAGSVLKILRQSDDDVPVLEPIAVIGDAGEDISSLLPEESSSEIRPTSGFHGTSATAGTSDASSDSDHTREQQEELRSSDAASPPSDGDASAAPRTEKPGSISPRANNLAAARGVDPGTLSGTGPGGRIIERDVLSRIGEGEPATPAAIEALLASGKTMPLQGSGIGGRVTTADLTDTVPTAGPTAASAPGSGAAASEDLPGKANAESPFTDTPVKSIRKVIAQRMRSSLAETAQLTLHTSAPADKLKAWRNLYKISGEAMGLHGITINDLVLFAVTRLLPLYPELNSHFLGDTIRTYRDVNLGIAVDTPRGLMVPVIHRANTRSLKTLSGEVKQLAAACREGTAPPDQLSGGTFTVTNLGAFGIERFTPVLNNPEVAILGVGTIDLKPVEDGDEVRFVPHIGLSLTIDHQAVDGAPGARFLKALSDALGNPETLAAL